jgi:hypothetical protein
VSAGERHRPAAAVAGRQPRHARVDAEGDAVAAGQRDEAVAHVAGAVRRREILPRFRFERERNADVFLEEAVLLAEGPGSEQVADDVRRSLADETGRLERLRQDVAAPAAADQDLAPALAGRLEHDHRDAVPAGMDRGGEAGRARTDDDDRASF